MNWYCNICKIWNGEPYRSRCNHTNPESIDIKWQEMRAASEIKGTACIICEKRFTSKKPFELCCSKECKAKKELKDEEHNKAIWTCNCTMCGKEIRKPEHSIKFCNDCAKERAREKYRKEHPKKNEIERFLEKKKKRTGPSLDELIRRMEWKRVMDDDGWDHYNRGRKYDKI